MAVGGVKLMALKVKMKNWALNEKKKRKWKINELETMHKENTYYINTFICTHIRVYIYIYI